MDNNLFKNPPKEYSEIPLWSWNDRLEQEELRRQIRLMNDGGWKAFFMHPRRGLHTGYMGRKWMECVKACVDEARKLGMEAWLYDEDTWPSGFAGGLSIAADASYRFQYLVCKLDNRPAFLEERIATFKAREVDGKLTDVHVDETPDLIDEQDRVIQFYAQITPLGVARFAPTGVERFNEYSYFNSLNPEAVRSFLDSTHEAYDKNIGNDFGGVVPGIMTDEPSLRAWMDGDISQPRLPWNKDLPDMFKERRGYDLMPHLPSLFYDVGDFHSVRYDYRRTVTERFVESSTKQISNWCEAHNLAYTGHFMGEDTLLMQMQWIGAAMPHYPYMQIPGVDKLGRAVNERWGTVLTFKQLDSVVCQLGKPRAFCENYGCSGQDFSHTGRKWVGDWSYVMGANLHSPHIPLYSMRGERKRDFPQNLFFQQPWWTDNQLIADYFSRLSYALSRGERVVDILVVHPMGSAWALYRPGATHAVDQLDRPLDQLNMTLMQNHRDFHFADEMLMEPEAPCEGRVITDDTGTALVLGKMAYHVVIVPPAVTLSSNTVRLLSEFAASGGPVLAIEPTPRLIDARSTDKPVLPQTARIVTLDTLPSVLDELLPFDVRIPLSPSIWVHHRHLPDNELYFIANTELDSGITATVHLNAVGRLEAWDPATGDVRLLSGSQREGITEVTLDFPPAGSHLLVLHPGKKPVGAHPAVAKAFLEMPLPDEWRVTLAGPNSFTLDRTQVKIGAEEAWSKAMYVLDAHAAVAKAGIGTPFTLSYAFDAAIQPSEGIELAIESPDRYQISVNGQEIANTDTGWWTDTSFRKVVVGQAVRAGRNEIILSGVFDRYTEIESIYVIGNFGVAGRRLREENRHNGQVFDRYEPEFKLADSPVRIEAGSKKEGLSIDLTKSGFPFLAARATLSQTIMCPKPAGPVVLEVKNLNAAVAHVRVNGQHMGAIAWQPHQVDISAGLQEGENEIEIELAGTLRNLLGPHHLNGGDETWTGPMEFRDKLRWTDHYILVPFGFDGITLRMMR